ncbi:MAG: DNA polymerase III subunit delta [Caldimicrobium sp.]
MPLFTPLQIIKLIDLAKKNRIAPLYLFIGPYEISQEKAKEIYKVLLEKGSNLEVFDLRDKEQKKEFLRRKGFQEGLFGFRTIYHIIGGEEIPPSKVEEILNALRDKPQFFSWFILFENLEEKHPFYDFALEKGAIIPFHTKKREDLLESELLLILKEYQLHMEKKTASFFISLVGEDYSHFKNELEKLVLYALDERTITEEKILEIVVPLEEKAFYLIGEAFFTQGPEKTYKMISSLLDAKKEPGEILGYLYKYFKKLQILKDFIKENPELDREQSYTYFSKEWQKLKEDPLKEIPKILIESHPYALFNMKKHLKKIDSLDPLFFELFKAEWALKREFQPPQKVFQNLVFNLWMKLQSPSFKKAA